jgi:hypothetical protein
MIDSARRALGRCRILIRWFLTFYREFARSTPRPRRALDLFGSRDGKRSGQSYRNTLETALSPSDRSVPTPWKSRSFGPYGTNHGSSWITFRLSSKERAS